MQREKLLRVFFIYEAIFCRKYHLSKKNTGILLIFEKKVVPLQSLCVKSEVNLYNLSIY
jgi:hypothetical protein